jgi:ribosomal protein S27AE
MTPKTERETRIAVMSTLLGALLLGLFSPWVSDVWAHLADIELPKLSKQGYLSLLATFVTLCLLELVWIWRLVSKRLFLKQYEADPLWPGTAVHKKTKRRVCDNCLHKHMLALSLHYDPDNKRYGCGECGRQINPLPAPV